MTKFTPMAANEDDGGNRRRIHLREITGDTDSPLETVGQNLRAARIRRGDDLAAVSRALKIRKDHLDALESDRLDDLPGKTYAIGFVRSYARYLGLDATEMTERFKAEISGRSDEQTPPVSTLHEEEAKRLPYGGRVLAGVVILAVLYGVWHIFFVRGESTPEVPPPPPVASITQPQAPEPSATVPMTDTAAPAAGVAVAEPQPADPVAVTSPEAQAAVPAAVPSSGRVYGEQNRASARVVLLAHAATRVTVTGPDGRLYINRDLGAGESYYVPDIPDLRLALSNAGAVQVNLDGAALGRVGSEGVVVGRVSLDPRSLADRFNR